jgi:transposase
MGADRPAAADPAWLAGWSTVYNYFAAWEAAGVTQRMLDGLRDRVRLREGRKAEPSAAIIDSQSVKAAENVDASSRGYDAARRSTAANGVSR